jgi:uncharacterized Zn-binding protein involved in type VI secretion
MAHGIARKTTDTAGGGRQLAGGQPFCRVQGQLWVLIGDPVQSHGVGVHNSPVMNQGSGFIKINGIPVCREGHLASCGHASTGSLVMRISD